VAPKLHAAEVRYLADDTYLLVDVVGAVSVAKARGENIETISRLTAGGGALTHGSRALAWRDGEITEFDATTGISVRQFESDSLRISAAYYAATRDGGSAAGTIGFTAFPVATLAAQEGQGGHLATSPGAYLSHTGTDGKAAE
jgi:hypothetical protein